MMFSSRRIQRLDIELAKAQAELLVARAQLPTITEIRSLENAAAMLGAVSRLIPNNKSTQYSKQITETFETLNAFLLRQPEASDPQWFEVSVREHQSELVRDFKTPPPPAS